MRLRSIHSVWTVFLSMGDLVASTSVVGVQAEGNSVLDQSPTSIHSSSSSGDGGLGKDIVSNVVKAIQITTQENLFLANLFSVASKLSNLSLDATDAAIHIHVLMAYVDLLKKSLEILGAHHDKNTHYTDLIRKALLDATNIMTQSPVQTT